VGKADDATERRATPLSGVVIAEHPKTPCCLRIRLNDVALGAHSAGSWISLSSDDRSPLPLQSDWIDAPEASELLPSGAAARQIAKPTPGIEPGTPSLRETPGLIAGEQPGPSQTTDPLQMQLFSLDPEDRS
jgi:hypothetical protein